MLIRVADMQIASRDLRRDGAEKSPRDRGNISRSRLLTVDGDYNSIGVVIGAGRRGRIAGTTRWPLD